MIFGLLLDKGWCGFGCMIVLASDYRRERGRVMINGSVNVLFCQITVVTG